MDNGVLLAIFVYLWAGYWQSYGINYKTQRDTPQSVQIIAYLVSLLAWGLLFPIYQVISDKKRKKEVH